MQAGGLRRLGFEAGGGRGEFIGLGCGVEIRKRENGRENLRKDLVP